MGERPDDLVPLLTGSPGDSGPVRWGQGVVVSWNPLTAENVIHFRGTDLTNLRTVASSSEVLAMKPGDVVGLNIVGSGASATVYVVGRITTPGTPQAASFLSVFGVKSADVDTNEILGDTGGSFVSLTGGPAVSDVLIGSTGRALVTVSADVLCAPTGASNRTEGWMGFEISGATSVAPDVFDTLRVRFTRDADATGNPAVDVAASRQNLVENLNVGLHTFTAKYRAIVSGVGDEVEFQGRNITVMPL